MEKKKNTMNNKPENKEKRKYEFKSEKRKKMIISSTVLGLGIAAVLFGLSIGGYKLYSSLNGLEGLTMNANVTCYQPYNTSKCRSARNPMIKKSQELLYKLGYLKKTSDYNDGNYGPVTTTAVKAFQKKVKNRVEVSGELGPETLERLALTTNTKYFKIVYNKNGGSGNITGASSNVQVVFNGISTPISQTYLTKNNYVHVGYRVETTLSKQNHKIGCTSTNCTKGAKGYTQSQINKLNVYHSYIYAPGDSVSQTGWVNGQVLNFIAQYCPAGNHYDRTTSKCVKNVSNSKYSVTSAQYNTLVAVVCGESNVSYDGAKAVIDNIFNRVDKKYAKTTWGVITARGQYKAYYNSYTRNRRLKEVSNGGCKYAKQAVRDAMANPSKRIHGYCNFCATGRCNGDEIHGDNIYYNKCIEDK